MEYKPSYGVCKLCGLIFIKDSSDQRTCDECKRKSHFSRQKKPDGSLTIEEIAKKAALEHLSYGQYCAKHNI